MKILRVLFRAAYSVGIALVFSFFLAVRFFNYAGYTTLDRFFLVFIPTFSIAYLIFQISPGLWEFIKERSRAVRENLSVGIYTLGFLLNVPLAFAAVVFFRPLIKTSFSLILFTVILMGSGSLAGYYLVRRAGQSLRDGFLSKPLNRLLSLIPPALLLALIFAALQFPALFFGNVAMPANWLGWFIGSALFAAVLGLGMLLQFESRGYAQKARQTALVRFIQNNLPGLYAGGIFSLISLVLARALNQPALNINTVLFESDAGPWMFILGSPTEDVINRSVHPLVLITIRPLVRFAALFMAEQWQIAPILAVAALNGLCVFMAWLFVQRATRQPTYAFLFALLLGGSAAHLIFGALTDTYIFGATALIFFFLLIQAKETRFSVLIPAGLLVFGITITNIAQSVIGLFFNKFGFWRLVQYCITLFTAAVALTVFTSALYPNRQTFFFVPGDIGFETNFVKPVYESDAERLSERVEMVSRTLLLYSVSAPRPIEITANKPPRPTLDLKTFDARSHTFASYKGLANVPLALWLILLAGSFIFFAKGLRRSPHTPLMLSLLGSLAFNFMLHMNYGSELFLYAAFWTYALIFFIALAFAELAGKRWFETLLTVLLAALIINNFWFIFTILRAVAPFYAST